MADIRLITLDPGHFHAALVQKEMYANVARRAHVYAPLGPDLVGHLTRIAGFNGRKENPTGWELEVHAGPDYLHRLTEERAGNVVVLAGKNHVKIDYILAALNAGLNVLADKPWIIAHGDMPKLEAALDLADEKRLVAYDIMTERHEVTSMLQRELVNDPETFGEIVPGSAEEPGVVMESMHYLKKLVAGVPLRRPAWFFDVAQQGEGLTDVGTHLVDLVTWMLFPDQSIDYRRDVQVHKAQRWPTVLTRTDFQQVTGEADFPASLAAHVRGDRLDYFCNTRVGYTIRGVQVQLNVLWDLESTGGGDTHYAAFRGSRARVEIRQGKEENYRPELYVVPNRPGDRQTVRAALDRKAAALQARYPGVAVHEQAGGFRVAIPDRFRIGHEAHFGEVTRQFLHFLADRWALPAWEKPNMLAKYFVTTRALSLPSLQSLDRPPGERLVS